MAVNSMSMARHTLTAFVTAFLVFLVSVPYCIAGDAVFSSDGERVLLISDIESKPAVEEIDLNKKTTRKIPLAQLDSSDGLRGITCAQKNCFFCTTAKAVCSFEPESGRLIKVRDAPTGVSFPRIAYDPKMQRVFVTRDDREHPVFMFNDPAEWIPAFATPSLSFMFSVCCQW
jgi:sugar lactone lactonase YvrE